MLNTIDNVLVVLNDFEKIDDILKKALVLSTNKKAILEVLFVYEKSLFDVPDYFHPKNSFIDKEKIKIEIKNRLLELGKSGDCAILVFVDDTVDRVLSQTKEPKQTLIVTTYKENITQELVKKSSSSFLVIKNKKSTYKNIILPVDLSEYSLKCINFAKTVFPQSQIKLLYDNHIVLHPEAKEEKKELFESLKKETNLEGYYIKEHIVSEVDFIEELYNIEKHLASFINRDNFDLTILCSHHRDFLFSNSLSFDMLGMIQNDILLLKSYHKKI